MPDRLNVALLSVNRTISQEAFEALFTVNAVAVHEHPQATYRYESMPLVRRVFLDVDDTRDDIDDWYDITSAQIGDIVRHLTTAHPKLQSIEIDQRTLEVDTVREMVEHSSFCRGLRCVDIGLFEVFPQERLAFTIWVRNDMLMYALPRAKELLAKGLDTLYEMWRDRGLYVSTRSMQYTRELDFAIYLGGYEILAEHLFWGDAFRQRSAADLQALGRIMTDTCLRAYVNEIPASAKPPLIPVRLSEITADDYGSETLEWASDVLGVGVHNMEYQ